MGKRLRSQLSLVSSLLLVSQFATPVTSALAAADTGGATGTAQNTQGTATSATDSTGTTTSTETTTQTTGTTTPTETTTPTGTTTPTDTTSTGTTTTFTPMAAVASTLLPPSNLTVQNVTPDDIKLTWSSVYSATGYNVYGIIDGELRMLGTTTTNSYSFNNLKEGSYTYVVTTLSADGESGPGAPTTADIAYPEMAAPATFTYAVQNGNDIVLNWGASQYAESYNVYQVAADGQKTLVTTATGRTYTVSNAAAGTYTYAVTSANSLYGESGLSTSATVELTQVTMVAPENVTSSITNGNDVTLKWGSVPYTTVYNVYQVSADGTKKQVQSATGTSLTLVNQPEGDYSYVVTAASDRFGESAASNPVAVKVAFPTMAVPANFKYSLANTNDITLSWNGATYANAYKVYQVIDGQKVLQKTVTGTSVTFTNMPEDDYTYIVTSTSDRFGESAETAPLTFHVTTPDMVAPTGFAYKVQNGNDVVLSWNTVQGASNYKVYQVAANGTKTLKSTVTGTSVTYANLPGGDYTYQVYSYASKFGESAEGSQVNFSLVLPTMTAPTNFVQSITSATAFSLNWDAVPYATSYKVYQIVNGTKVLKSTVTGTSVAYTNMAAGNYNYEVHSVSSRYGESTEGTTLSFTMNGQTMPAPTNPLYTIANGNDITLKWTAAQYATSYKVYQVAADGTKTLKSTVTGTSVTYANLPGGDYHYVIDAVSTLLGESPTGADVSFTLTLPAMQAPGNVTSKIQNGNDVVLNWAASTYANSYKVYEIVDGQPVLKSTVTGLGATISNVTAGDHVFEVHAVSTRFGESAEGSQVSLTMEQTTMAAPGNLTQTLANGNDITLRWNAVTYANRYNIYAIIDGQNVLQKTVTGTSNTFTNLPEGDYTYVVTAVSDRFGESDGSKVSLTVDFPTMQAPGTLTDTIANGNDITLKWGTATYNTAYKVYQVAADGTKTLVKSQTGTSLTLTNMPEGDYTYEVHSYSDRFGESPEGSNLSFSLAFPTMQAPGTLTDTIANGNDITLKWGTASYNTAYKVYQVAADGTKTLVKSQTGTSLTLTNMPAGTYNYEVHSYSDRFGESPVASTVHFDLIWPVVQPPVLTANVANANNLTLSWPSVQWANEYHVYKINNDGSKDLLYKGTSLSYQIFNMAQDTFSYEVTAFSTRFGESQSSNRTTVTIVYPEMQAPTATATVTGPSSAKLTWSFATYANGYNVYEIVNGKPVLLVQNLNALSYTLTNLSYANHQYYITSYSNSFGESKPSNTVTAQLITDTVAPVTKTNAPADWTNKAPVVVTLSATDNDTGVAHTYYSTDGSNFVEGNTFTVTKAGVSTVYYYSLDKAGNKEAVQSVNVKIDQTLPGTTANAPDGWSNGNVTLNFNVAENESGVANTYYSVNGASYVAGTSVTLSQEGVNTVSYYSVDKAGNAEQAKTATVKIDKTAPTTTADQTSTFSNEDVTVKLTANDDQSGLAKTYYSINGSDYVEGNSFTVDKEGVNSISFYSVDQAGNKESAKSVEVKLDKTAPLTTASAPSDWSKDDATVSLSATDAQSGVAKTFYSVNGSDFAEGTSIALTQEGINKVTFYSVDAAGNKEAVQTVEVKLDKTAPMTAANAPSDWTKDDATVSLTATDAQSGVGKTFYSVNGSDFVEGTSIALTQEGINKITFYSVDAAGNKEAEQTIEVKLDKTAPVTAANAPSDWSKDDATVNLTATDAQSGVAKTFYSVNGSDFAEGTSIALTQEGINKVTFYSVDAAGNKEAEQTIKVKLDKTAPVTAATAPSDWSKDDATVNLTATDAQSGVAKTFYSVNGSDFAEGTSIALTQEGINKVTFYSVDAAGNKEAEQTVEVKLDKTAPVTAANAPSDWTKDDVTLNFVATDAQSGVAKTYYSVNGSDYVEGTSVKLTQEGVNKVTFYSVDAAGNAEAAQTAEVKIDKTAPVVTTDLKDEYKMGTSLKLAFPITDASGVASQKIVVNGPLMNNKAVANGDTVKFILPGNYTITVTATDATGQTTTYQKKIVIYIPINIDVTAKKLKDNKGEFTVRVELPIGYSTAGFDLNSVSLNGTKALNSNSGFYNQAKLGQFKFERSDFDWNNPNQTYEFRGYVFGLLVVGQATVKIIK